MGGNYGLIAAQKGHCSCSLYINSNLKIRCNILNVLYVPFSNLDALHKISYHLKDNFCFFKSYFQVRNQAQRV